MKKVSSVPKHIHLSDKTEIIYFYYYLLVLFCFINNFFTKKAKKKNAENNNENNLFSLFEKHKVRRCYLYKARKQPLIIGN